MPADKNSRATVRNVRGHSPAPIHDSQDVRSYEFDSAARREQYFGEMHWDLARPLLVARLSR